MSYPEYMAKAMPAKSVSTSSKRSMKVFAPGRLDYRIGWYVIVYDSIV